MTNISSQPLWLTHFIEILLVLEFQLIKKLWLAHFLIRPILDTKFPLMEDRGKTTFTTQWGTYKYIHMPFGLQNANSTFQRAMDQEFSDLICKIIDV